MKMPRRTRRGIAYGAAGERALSADDSVEPLAVPVSPVEGSCGTEGVGVGSVDKLGGTAPLSVGGVSTEGWEGISHAGG